MASKTNTIDLKTIKQKATVDSMMASKKDEVVAAASNAANAATKESSSLIGAAVSRKLKDVTNNLSKGEGVRNDEKAAKTKKEATNGGTNGGTAKQRRRAPPTGPRNKKGKHIKMSKASKKRYDEDNSTHHFRITNDARKDNETTFAFSVNDSVNCGMSTFDPETQLLNFDADGFEGFCSTTENEMKLALTYFKNARFERIGSAPLSEKAPFTFKHREGSFIPNNNSSLRQIAVEKPSVRGAGTGSGSLFSSEEDLALVRYINTHPTTVINDVTDDDISSILPDRTVISMRHRMKRLFKTDSFNKAIKTAEFQQILQQVSSSSTLTGSSLSVLPAGSRLLSAGTRFSSEDDLALVQYVNTHPTTMIDKLTDDDISSILPGRTVISMKNRMKRLFKATSFKKAIKTAEFQRILQQVSSSSTLTGSSLSVASDAKPTATKRKSDAKPTATKRKSAAKSAAKSDAKPAAKSDAKPTATKRKSAAKPAAKSDAKSAATKRKSAAKPAAKSDAKSAATKKRRKVDGFRKEDDSSVGKDDWDRGYESDSGSVHSSLDKDMEMTSEEDAEIDWVPGMN